VSAQRYLDGPIGEMPRRRIGSLIGVVLLLISGCAALGVRPTDPLSAEERNDLGVAYQARGELDLAIREYRRALALRPGWPQALVNLGNAHLDRGEVEEAITAYEQALASAPEDPAILNNLAWAFLQHPTRWPHAEPLIRRALARTPPPRAYYLDTLGVVHLRKGEAAEALATFREALGDPALRDDPRTHGVIFLHAGDAHRALGDEARARACYREALARDPDGPGGRPARARLGDAPEGGVGPVAGVC